MKYELLFFVIFFFSSLFSKDFFEIYSWAVDENLYVFVTDGKKSYILSGNSFKRVDNDFFVKTLDSYPLPKERTAPKMAFSLISVAWKKGFKVYFKGETAIYLYGEGEDHQIKLISSTIAAPKKSKSRKKSLFFKSFHIGLKRISLGSYYTYSPVGSYAPYYKFSFPLAIMLELGLTPLRTTTSLSYAFDVNLLFFFIWPKEYNAPSLFLGIGQQHWPSDALVLNSFEGGIALWKSRLAFLPFIKRMQLSYSKKTAKNEEGITEIKFSIGLFD